MRARCDLLRLLAMCLCRPMFERLHSGWGMDAVKKSGRVLLVEGAAYPHMTGGRWGEGGAGNKARWMQHMHDQGRYNPGCYSAPVLLICSSPDRLLRWPMDSSILASCGAPCAASICRGTRPSV